VLERSTVDCVKEMIPTVDVIVEQKPGQYRLVLSRIYNALMEFNQAPIYDVISQIREQPEAVWITYIRNPAHVKLFQEIAKGCLRRVMTILVTRDVGPIQNNNADELVFSDMSIFDAIVVNDGTLEDLEQIAVEFVKTHL